jgi:nitrogen fixation NifU-like protein
MYSKKVLQHFTHPKFFGKIKNPDVIGKAGNPRCGDLLTLYLKIDEKTPPKARLARLAARQAEGGKKIKDIKFETLGCAAAIAASDMICQLVKGKNLHQAMNISFEDVSKELGILPPLKIHCAQLVIEALRDAIDKYREKIL